MATTPTRSIDLGYFVAAGREWLAGVHRPGEGILPLYPPFAIPLFGLLALVDFSTLRFAWLALNLTAAAASLGLVCRLFGRAWPARVRVDLAAFFLAWAAFRLTLRNGQLSLAVTALVLGTIAARERGRDLLAGTLLGLSLVKWSLTLPFLAYFVVRRELRLAAVAVAVPTALLAVYCARLGVGPFDALVSYLAAAGDIHAARATEATWMGTMELKPLFVARPGGGDELLGTIAASASTAFALVAAALVFPRRPRAERLRFAVLALLGLSAVYHRTYDAVLCLLPAAALTDLAVRGRHPRASRAWLVAFGLLIVDPPGLAVDRLGVDPTVLRSNPLGFLVLHAERLLVLGCLWWLLWVMWRDPEPAGVKK